MVRRRGTRFQIVRVGKDSYIWRMLCSNGREAGRGVEALGSISDCFDALATLRLGLARAQMETLRHPDGNRSWRLSVDGAALARSAGSYDRIWDMTKAFDLFRSSAAHSLLDPTIIVSLSRGTAAAAARPLGAGEVTGQRIALAPSLHDSGTVCSSSGRGHVALRTDTCRGGNATPTERRQP